MPASPPTHRLASSTTQVDRRHLIRGTVAVAAAAGVVTAAGGTSAVGAASLPAWSDPATWGTAGVPRPGTVVVIDFPVRLDTDIQVAGLHIECGGHLVFDPARSVSIRATGNVEVCGVLEMRPAGPKVEHLLRFEGIDEAKFVGGGMDVLASDVGLWVHGDGQLDLSGTPRTAWVRAYGSLDSGTRSIRLAARPVGWQVGDELVITPTASPVDERHSERFDTARIASVSGSTVTLTAALRYGHPAVAVGDGHVLTAEVLNLTRNVRVEGTPTGRTHTMALMTKRPSQVRYAAFRHFGPRRNSGKDFVLGRYGMHWHMAGDGSRGSVVEGVVMRDGGSHAFVAHLSNGVTHRACVSYNTAETPYWWDPAPGTATNDPPSDDVTYDSCVAALVLALPEYRGYDLAGFELSAGTGNSARNCVAVGVQGNSSACGFRWGSSVGNWDFANCVAHNNKLHGINTWQNTPMRHVVQLFVGYHNGGSGIAHGSYINGYTYKDSILFGNKGSGMRVHAVSRGDVVLSYEGILVDCAGQSGYAVEFIGHTLEPLAATRVVNCRLRGYTQAGIAVTGDRPEQMDTTRDWIDVLGCQFSGNQLWIGPRAHPDTLVRIANPRATLSARHRGASVGRLRESWNALVTRAAGTPGTSPSVAGPAPISLGTRAPL